MVRVRVRRRVGGDGVGDGDGRDGNSADGRRRKVEGIVGARKWLACTNIPYHSLRRPLIDRAVVDELAL